MDKKNGVQGRLVTSRINGASVFLPVTGYLDNSLYHTSAGYYWSKTLSHFDERKAFTLEFGTNEIFWSQKMRCFGLCIRPVYSKIPTQISNVISETTSKEIKNIYSIDGSIRDHFVSGINIIEYIDGTKVKIVK